MSFILALDQGTTSSRAILFDHAGDVRAVAQREFRQIFPQPGWVEHDAARDLGDAVGRHARGARQGRRSRARDVAAIGITNQRETTVLWDRATGAPIAHAIVWQDRRTAPLCDALRAAGHAPLIARKTGLVLDAYFSGTKLKWLLDNVPGARARAREGRARLRHHRRWLVWNLTGGAVHVTDPSNASRTLLFDIRKGAWDDELLRAARRSARGAAASRAIVGDLRATRRSTASTCRSPGSRATSRRRCSARRAFAPGLAKNTYGTGCFLLMNTGSEARSRRRNNLLTTVAWQRDGATDYALEGSVFIGGAVVQWLRDGLGIIRAASEIEALAASVPDNGGVYFVPAFAGLGAPHWDAYARGAIFGPDARRAGGAPRARRAGGDRVPERRRARRRCRRTPASR